MKSLYLAAPWDHKDKAKAVRAQFEEAGWEVTSNWLDYPDGYLATETELRQEAIIDLHDVARSQVLVLLNGQARGEETSGKAVEMGYALGKGIPVIVVGKWSNIFHFLPQVTLVNTVEEAIKEAKKWGQ